MSANCQCGAALRPLTVNAYRSGRPGIMISSGHGKPVDLDDRMFFSPHTARGFDVHIPIYAADELDTIIPRALHDVLDQHGNLLNPGTCRATTPATNQLEA